MFRRALVIGLVVAVVAMLGPSSMFAQAPNFTGSIAGRAIDATGGAVGAQRVELLRGGSVVNVASTGSLGDWVFADVWPGEYVVRLRVKDKTTGVRVSVRAGENVAGALIVAPTAMVSPQLSVLANLVTLIPSAAAAVTTGLVSAGVETDTTGFDEEQLMDVLDSLTPTQRLNFAIALIQAIDSAGSSSSPFKQYEEQLETIFISRGNEVPVFQPPVPVS